MQRVPPKDVCTGVLEQPCQTHLVIDMLVLDFGDSPTPCVPSTSIFLIFFQVVVFQLKDKLPLKYWNLYK